MKSEEAIRNLVDTLQEAHSEAIRSFGKLRTKHDVKGVGIDLVKTSKLDRSRWEECPDCWLWERTYRFCPACGRPLNEEARAELDRRINHES